LKKYFHSKKFKVFSHSRSIRSFKRNRIWKSWKKEKNRIKNEITKDYKLQNETQLDRFTGYKKIYAPANFSFVDNPIEIIKFINKLSEAFDDRKKVFIILEEVTTLTHDSIIVLLSILIRFKSKKIAVNGNFPRNREASEQLRKSGFFEYLYKSFSDKSTYNLTDRTTLHTHASKMVDSELGFNIIQNVTAQIWNEKRIYKGFQRTLIELMQNTNNHAAGSGDGEEKHWWLSVNANTTQKTAGFAFIDYGVGIFESLNTKPAGHKFADWATKLRALFTFENNAEILKLILNGELHKTVSKQYYRGKGLPGIKEAMDRNQISKLAIITNNVYANIERDEYKQLNINFTGTFIYWEITDQNIYHPWTT
jgi:hypothetical protein